MPEARKPEDFPFQCRRIGGTSAMSGHETQAEADANVRERNIHAEALGVEARYETFTK